MSEPGFDDMPERLRILYGEIYAREADSDEQSATDAVVHSAVEQDAQKRRGDADARAFWLDVEHSLAKESKDRFAMFVVHAGGEHGDTSEWEQELLAYAQRTFWSIDYRPEDEQKEDEPSHMDQHQALCGSIILHIVRGASFRRALSFINMYRTRCECHQVPMILVFSTDASTTLEVFRWHPSDRTAVVSTLSFEISRTEGLGAFENAMGQVVQHILDRGIWVCFNLLSLPAARSTHPFLL